MAPVIFDVATAKEKRLFNFTLGKSRETSRWTDRVPFNFATLSGHLSKVPPVGAKDGTCYTPALFNGYVRNLQFTTQIDVVVLDSDCGHSFEDIRRTVAHKGWRAIIHSTYSHMTEQTVIAASAYHKWRDENPGRTVGQYMMAKKGFLPAVMEGAHIVDDVADGKSSNLIINHAPCPKFRIILPLYKPWLAEDYESQDLANAKWRERIGALAYALGLHHDQSCSDTSRLFYFPRVKDAAALASYVCHTLDGEDCDIWSLPDAVTPPESDAGAAGGMASLFSSVSNVVPMPARTGAAAIERKTYVNKDTGEIFDLTNWIMREGSRFEIVKAIRERAPNILSPRRPGVKQHIYCVRSGDHMTGGIDGTGTYIVNASDLSRAGMPSIKSGFVINCMHNGCKGVDRLDHIRSMLESGTLSVDDLTNPEFLSVEYSKVEIAPFLNKKEPEPEKVKPEIKKESESSIAESLYRDMPAALGCIHKYMMDTATKPQPILAMGAALAFCATVVGQRVQLERFETRPNVYILGVGVSGSGKDRPMKACKQIARSAGLFKELIGVEEVASDTGIVASVINAPRQLILIDEVGDLLSAISDPRAGSHLKGVIGTLLKLYSGSNSTYQSKSYADTERVKLIDQPCVSFFGTSTPRGLSDALTNKDIESGLLSRMVVFDSGENDPRIGIPKKVPVPQEILEWISAWHAVKPIPNAMHTIGGDPVIEPRTVMLTEEAYAIAMAFEGEMHDAKGKARSRNKDSLYVRAFENALKFALIRACAIWPVTNAAGNGIMVDESALRVDAQTMRWAVDLSRATVAKMDGTTDDIADTDYERNMKALRKAIERSGKRGLTSRDLARTPAGKMSDRALNELLKTLIDAEEIKQVKMPPTGRGRPREPYIHKKYFEYYGLQTSDDLEDEAMAGE